MGDLIWLSEAQIRRIEPHFPVSHGVPRVDDRTVISGIIFVIGNGLRWRDAPKDYGPHKTIYIRAARRLSDRYPSSDIRQIGLKPYVIRFQLTVNLSLLG